MNKEQQEPIYAQVNKKTQKGGGQEPIYADLKHLGGTPYQNTKKNGTPIHDPSDETIYSEVRVNKNPEGQTHKTREEMRLSEEPVMMSLEDMGLTRRQQPQQEHGDRGKQTHKTREEMRLTEDHKHEHGDRGKQTHKTREEMRLTEGHKHEHGDRGKQTHMSREKMGLATPPPTPPKPSKGYIAELRDAVSKQAQKPIGRRNAMSGVHRPQINKGPKM